MKTEKIIGKIAENGYSMTSLAKSLRMTPSTFSRKLHHASFNLNELIAMSKALKLSNEEIIAYFFDFLSA